MAASKNFIIEQGKTFAQLLRWETLPIIYKQITNISQSAPVRLTVPGHGVPDGWRCAVTNVKGMTEINATANALKDKDYHQATVVNQDIIEFNDTNATGFKPYLSGGTLQYNTPTNLAGFTARMMIRRKLNDPVLCSLTTENGGISISPDNKRILVTISADDTAAFDWNKGVYDLEMIAPDGTVTALLSGLIHVTKEITK